MGLQFCRFSSCLLFTCLYSSNAEVVQGVSYLDARKINIFFYIWCELVALLLDLGADEVCVQLGGKQIQHCFLRREFFSLREGNRTWLALLVFILKIQDGYGE